MTDRQTEDRAPEDLAPENHNSDQDDAPEQAQTLAEEVLGGTGRTQSPTESTKHKSPGDLDDDSTQDLIDHMRDMEQSGRIDYDAFRGEDNHDDNEDKFGDAAKLDPQLPSDGS